MDNGRPDITQISGDEDLHGGPSPHINYVIPGSASIPFLSLKLPAWGWYIDGRKREEETHLPPTLALFFCIVFVLFLLRLDRKQSPDVSRALWVPTVWVIYIASKPLGEWFQQSSSSPDAGSPMDRAFLIVLMLAALLILFLRNVDWAGALKEHPWVMALIMFMLVSVLWSNIPFISFKRWVREFQAVLMALVVLSESSPRRAMESILRRTTYVLIPFSPLLIKYFPVYGVQYGQWSGEQMWVGVSLQKNGLAYLCIISALFLIWTLAKRWQGNNPRVWKYQTHMEILVLAMTFWLLAGPRRELFYSATSTYTLIASLLVLGLLHLAKKRKIYVKAAWVTTIVAVVIIFGVVSVFTSGSRLRFFASSAGRDATLTGRTEVWASLLPVVMRSPLVGGGFGGFWTPTTRELFRITGAHSGYLDVLIGLGFVGIMLVSLFFLSSCRKAHQEISRDFDWGALWICYIIMSVVHNIGESSMDSFTSYLTAIVLFFTVSSSPIFRGKRDSIGNSDLKP
jgi:O-antigen ligase